MKLFRKRGQAYFLVMGIGILLAIISDTMGINFQRFYLQEASEAVNYASSAFVSTIFVAVGTVISVNGIISLNHKKYSGLTLHDLHNFSSYIYRISYFHLMIIASILFGLTFLTLHRYNTVYVNFFSIFITMFVYLHIYRNFMEHENRRLKMILREVNYLLDVKRRNPDNAKGVDATNRLRNLSLNMFEHLCSTKSTVELTTTVKHIRQLLLAINSFDYHDDIYAMADEIVRRYDVKDRRLLDTISNMSTKDGVCLGSKMRTLRHLDNVSGL